MQQEPRPDARCRVREPRARGTTQRKEIHVRILLIAIVLAAAGGAAWWYLGDVRDPGAAATYRTAEVTRGPSR